MSSFEWDKASREKQSREKTPPEMPSQALTAQASWSNVGAFGSGWWDEAGCHSEVTGTALWLWHKAQPSCSKPCPCSPASRLRSAGRGLSQLGEVGGSGGQSSTHDPSGHRLDLPQRGTLHPTGAGFLCIVSVIEAQKPFV